jgi:hypothetical protein
MRMVSIICVLAAVLLAGCTARVTPPKVEIETAAPVVVEVGKRGGNRGFCPPGQRKQGNC